MEQKKRYERAITWIKIILTCSLSKCFLKVVTETPGRFLSGNGRQLKSLGPLVVKLLSMRFAVFATVALEGMSMLWRRI